jgi:hypothetical protein
MNKMEGELLYYRGLLSGDANQRNNFTLYPSGGYRPSGTGGDIAAYSTVPAYSYAPSMPSLLAPALANEYQRAGSYDNSSTGFYSPTGNAPLGYSKSIADQRPLLPERSADSSKWAYLHFSTSSVRASPLLMGQPIMAQAPPVPSLTSSPALLPSL